MTPSARIWKRITRRLHAVLRFACLALVVSQGSCTDGKPLIGVYCGNDPNAVLQFESWFGRPVNGLLGYTGAANWSDYDGSVGWAVGLWKQIDRRVFWSVPLIPTGATLEAAAAGDYNDHYLKAARTLATYRPQDPEIHIRTGWEFNGDWFPWSAHGKPQAFVGAFRQFVTAFRSVSNRFVFEWNVNVGDVGMNPETAYPGDAYVDIIGMDFYWNTEWDPADPIQAWNSMLNRSYGLQWHQNFAAAHGKRTAYSEWGVRSNNAGPYIERAKAWFTTHKVVFHTYWNSNSAFPGKLSDNQYPNAGAAYRAAFAAP
ncbi:MAG TPA: glycosyl hydrolase [Polyangiaceae bacterium]|nr:glycosyl hydrolase [Polyangiaceae bacterium]